MVDNIKSNIKYYANINDRLQNKISQKISDHFDSDFNKQYDEAHDLNGNINTRETLIKINDRSSDRQNNFILILQYLLALIFFGFFVVLGFVFKLYSASTMRYIFLASFIFYVAITYYQIYYNEYTIGDYNSTKFAKEQTHSLFQNVISNIIPIENCPEGCKNKNAPLPPRCPPNMPNCNDNPDSGELREMRTDSTVNNWVRGDVGIQKGCRVDRKTGKLICEINNDKEMIYESPLPAYQGIDPAAATVYQCVSFDGSRTMTTTIPCSYFINFSYIKN